MDDPRFQESPMTNLSTSLQVAKISSLKKKLPFSPMMKGSASSVSPLRMPLSSLQNVLKKQGSAPPLFQSGLRVSSTPPGRCARRFNFDNENSPVVRSPSRYTVVIRQRNLLLEDAEGTSSQDSAISEGSFRFAEPSGFAPKKTTDSPRRCLTFSCENLSAFSNDSGCSTTSSDGFSELNTPDEDSNSFPTRLGTLLSSSIPTPTRPKKRRSTPPSSGAKRAKPLGDRASEENKGTLFQYGFTRKAKLERSASDSEEHIKMALQRSTQEELIGDFTRPFALPLMAGKHQDLKSISSETLSKLINGEFNDRIASYKIVDCRYPYEYEGGHIKGAFNLFTCKHILDELLESRLCKDRKTNDQDKRDILIFHCEFSSERGPFLSRFLRKEDRAGNEYPHLSFPETYLLHGGYKAFFAEHKELCEPQTYRTMQDPAHSSELKHFRAKSKTSAPNNHKKMTARSLSRIMCEW